MLIFGINLKLVSRQKAYNKLHTIVKQVCYWKQEIWRNHKVTQQNENCENCIVCDL